MFRVKNIPTLLLSTLMISGVWTYSVKAAEGVVNAISREAIPAGQVIHVRALDDSTENLALKRRFEDMLRTQGHRVSRDGSLIFTFEVENEIGAWTSPGDRYFLELYARGSRTGGEDAAARFNVFDSQRGGILNKGQGKTNIVTPSKYRINVTVDSQPQNGQITRYWQAWAWGNLENYDSQTLTQSMVEPLVRSMGQTVRRETFALP